MNYFSLKGGYILTILLPTFFIISKILTFLYIYYDNKKVRRIFNYVSVIFSVISTIIIYFNISRHGEYFCFIWSGAIIIPLIIFNLMYRNKEKDETNYINIFELIIIIVSMIWGVIILIIPQSSIFTLIGGNSNSSIDRISIILFYTYGIVQITLDKPLAIAIRKLEHKKIKIYNK